MRWSNLVGDAADASQPPTFVCVHAAGLSAHEVGVLRLLVSGHTVHAHLHSIDGALDVSSRAAGTRFAVDDHLT